jgi:hypothetical protein
VKALRKLLLRVFGKLLVALSWLFEGLGWLLAGVVSLLEPVGKLLVFVAALAGLIVGLFMLWDDWRGFPVAAAFTRVGGPTRVETAVDASRFWLRPPRCVVETPANAWQSTMFKAAQYAMSHDAPLLFISQNPKRHQLVHATKQKWKDAWPQGSGLPKISMIGNSSDSKKCGAYGGRAGVSGLSTLGGSNQPLRLHLPVAVQDKLAPVVVFAVARGPRDSPDVAVGLALAAHLTRTDGEVSLVVVPRYFEADHELEQQLRDQRRVVQGGVVLGSAGILPEDTQALLRQVLTSIDRQNFLSQLQTDLGSVDPLVSALLALVGLWAAARLAREAKDQLNDLGRKAAESGQRINRAAGSIKRASGPGTYQGPGAHQGPATYQESRTNRRGPTVSETGQSHAPPELTAPAGADWLTPLTPDDRAGKVTVWLRSGWKVTGTLSGSNKAVTVFRINNAKILEPGQKRSRSEKVAAFILVPVKDIELISAPQE